MIWHRLFHGAGIGKARVCGPADEFHVPWILCVLREFRENKMAGERQRVRSGDIVSAIEVPRGKLHDVRCIAEAQLADDAIPGR